MANVSNQNFYSGTEFADSITGTNGSDTLSGASGNDTIWGRDGNDIISGESDNDELYGEAGDDTISGGNGDDYIEGGFGSNSIEGGAGFDTVSYRSNSAGVRVTLGGSGVGTGVDVSGTTDTLKNIESVWGSAHGDTLTGSEWGETFQGRGGNDSIDGQGGTDRLTFSRALAAVHADLSTGISKDLIDATEGISRDVAGVGIDTFVNIERFTGSAFGDYLSASGFGTTVGARNISSNITLSNQIGGGKGNDTIIGNGATELQFNFLDALAGVVVDLQQGTAESTWSGSDTLLGAFNGVIGTNYADLIIGDNLNSGGQTFTGLAGNDTFEGGGGYDSSFYGGSLSSISVDLSAGTVIGGVDVGQDTLIGIEAIVGSPFEDVYRAQNYGFLITNPNLPDNGLFNSFEGRGGNDLVSGNGVTRIDYRDASAAVWVSGLDGKGRDLADHLEGTSLDAAKVGIDTFSGVNGYRGGLYSDVLIGGNKENDLFEQFDGRAGDDSIYGGSGFDRAFYDNDGRGSRFIDLSGEVKFTVDENGEQVYKVGLTVNMAAGIVSGDPVLIGTDMLREVEGVRGTMVDDFYDARGFSAQSLNAGSLGFYNDFEGNGGNDTVIGNGHTRLNYFRAMAPVYVNLQTNESLDLFDQQNQTNKDAAYIGKDSIGEGINSIAGSRFSDVLIGGRSANDLLEVFDGARGDDVLSGGSGFDRARYDNSGSINAWVYDGVNLKFRKDGAREFTEGITVDLASGSVQGDANWIGNDTLLGIESVFGTILADTYDATGFSGTSENAGAYGTFNEFQGRGGDDRVIGNGNTRVSYFDSYAGVFVDLANGTSSGLAAGDAAFVGTDTIVGGVNAVRGSASFGDVLIGSSEGDILEGMGGDDSITGGSGNDRIDGGAGQDTAIYAGDLSSVISIGRSADGLSVVIRTSNEGTDTLTNIESIQFGLAPALSVQDALASVRETPVFSAVRTDLNAARSDGVELSEGSAVEGEVVAQAIDTSAVLLMPEVYTGPVTGIDYQLIDTTPDAIIVGSTFNDFIVLQGTGSKAVDGGGGANVIDGGTGSTFITGGGVGESDTFFLDGRAPGVSWSTITDFELGLDRATIWGWKEGVSRVLALDGAGGAPGYQGLTLHFENLLPDGAADTDTNDFWNSITLTGMTLEDFGASSLEELNAQIANKSNDHFRVDQTVDALGEHGYLYIS